MFVIIYVYVYVTNMFTCTSMQNFTCTVYVYSWEIALGEGAVGGYPNVGIPGVWGQYRGVEIPGVEVGRACV